MLIKFTHPAQELYYHFIKMFSLSTIKLIALILFVSITTNACTDTNCKVCKNPAICDQCKISFYLDNNTCVSCATRVANCSNCTLINNNTDIVCNGCVDSFVINQTDNTCLACKLVDSNCIKCNFTANQIICTACKDGTVYNDSDASCIACSAAFANCFVCNNTFLPLSCVSCQDTYYSNKDASKCDTCQKLIPDCAECSFQAPYEQVQCATCVQDKQLSDDKYSCNDPSHLALIVGIVVGVLVVIGAVAFGVHWYRKKKAQRASFHDEVESYQKV